MQDQPISVPHSMKILAAQALRVNYSVLGMPKPVYGFVDFDPSQFIGMKKGNKHHPEILNNVTPSQRSYSGGPQVVESSNAATDNLQALSPVAGGYNHSMLSLNSNDRRELLDVKVESPHRLVTRTDLVRTQAELMEVHSQIMRLEEELRKIRPLGHQFNL